MGKYLSIKQSKKMIFLFIILCFSTSPLALFAQQYELKCYKDSLRLYYCGGEKQAERGEDIFLSPVENPTYTALAHAYPDDLLPHRGIDLIGNKEIMAAASGQVVFVCNIACLGGYGRYVIILHDNGLYTLYGHLAIVYVSVDQIVKRQDRQNGDIIGIMGNTGNSQGIHLHFEVRSKLADSYQNRLDPVAFLTISISECSDMFGLASALQSSVHKYQQWYGIEKSGKIISKKKEI
ncbi:MAG: M23 family metallopeptidase [Culicoidibacterales bacterium]